MINLKNKNKMPFPPLPPKHSLITLHSYSLTCGKEGLLLWELWVYFCEFIYMPLNYPNLVEPQRF